MSESSGIPAKRLVSASHSSQEQQFCNDALDSREFDDLSDEQWVALCEQVAHNSDRLGDISGSELKTQR